MKSICNFGYARTKKGGAHFPDVRGLLKYVQYRDDRDDHIPGGGGPDRWVDGGLGDQLSQDPGPPGRAERRQSPRLLLCCGHLP